MPIINDDRQFRIEDNVLEGKEVPYDDEHNSLGEFVLRRLDEDPDFVGQIDAVTGDEYTYRKMRERSVRCALWMQSQGLRPKDVVALCTDDHMDHAMPCFAALYLGAVCCPWDVLCDLETLLRLMGITKPKMIFVSESAVPDIVEAAKMTELDVKIIVFGRVPGFLEFESILTKPRIDQVEKFVFTPIQYSGEIAYILFSSGTTGAPKSIALSHRALTMLAHQAKALGMNGNVCLTFGAVGWISMAENIFVALLLKIPRFALPRFEGESTCALVEKYKANWVYFYPTMIREILKSDAFSRYDMSSLNRILYCGASLPGTYRRAFAELLPKVQITAAYGMTEACGYIAIQSAKSPPGSCGRIAENARVKVIDPDTGRTLGPNQKGELLVKFACMMNGYYEHAQATVGPIDDEGWLHSGDIGYYDEAGEVFVVDRIKDIIRNDYDISPSEIEDVVLSHPGVEEVVVVGKPDTDGFEIPIAFVVRAEDSSDPRKQVTEEEIVDLVAATLPPSRHLRAGVRFIDRIPKTPSNKVRRLVLRDMARSPVAI